MLSFLYNQKYFSAYSRRNLDKALIETRVYLKQAPDYNKVFYKSVFACDVVYGRRHRHDTVTFEFNKTVCVRLAHAVFAH